MRILKITGLAVATASILALAPAAYANSTNLTLTTVANGVNPLEAGLNNGSYTSGHIADRLLGSSETATAFYKTGVKQFEKGNLEKSDYAFRAALRADGSMRMDKLTLHYLTLISDKQGDELGKMKYAQAYFNLDKK